MWRVQLPCTLGQEDDLGHTGLGLHALPGNPWKSHCPQVTQLLWIHQHHQLPSMLVQWSWRTVSLALVSSLRTSPRHSRHAASL